MGKTERLLSKKERLENIKEILTAPLFIMLIIVVGIAGLFCRLIFEAIVLIVGRRV